MTTSDISSAVNDPFVTASNSQTNQFVNQIAYIENWAGSGNLADAYSAIARKPKFLYLQHGEYVCYEGFVYKYRQDIVNSFDWTYST